jgi:nicotinamide riboside transporter PnuC
MSNERSIFASTTFDAVEIVRRPGRDGIVCPVKRTVRLSLGAWLIYLSVLAPSLATLDGGAMLNVALSVVQKHDISVEPGFGAPGRGGKFYDIRYPLLPFLAIPFVAVGLFVAQHAHLPADYIVAIFAILLSTMICASTVGATYYLARERLGTSERRAVAASLVFGFATMALRQARSFYADPLVALLETVALIVMTAETPNAWLLACLCGLAILAKPTAVLVGIAAFTYLVLRRNYRAALISALGSAIGVGLYSAYDWARFGSIFVSGQPNVWSLRTAPIGFAGLLISPSVGLLVCCPVLILALRKPRDSNTRLILGLSVGYLLLYSFWQGWFDLSWGPRHLTPIVPALMGVSVLTKYRRLWLGLALFGAVLQIPTVVGSPERYDALLSARGITYSQTVWSLRLAPTVGIWRSSFDQVRDALQHPDVHDFGNYRPTANTLGSSRNYRILPIWWWMLPLIHVPRLVGFLVALAEAFAGLWIIANRSVLGSAR